MERQRPVSWFMSSRGQCSSRKGPVLGEVVGSGARRLARRAGACPLSPSVRGVLGVSSRDVTDRVDRISAGGRVRGRTRGSRSRLGGFAGVRAFTHTSYERAEKTGTGQEWAMGSGGSHGRGGREGGRGGGGERLRARAPRGTACCGRLGPAASAGPATPRLGPSALAWPLLSSSATKVTLSCLTCPFSSNECAERGGKNGVKPDLPPHRWGSQAAAPHAFQGRVLAARLSASCVAVFSSHHKFMLQVCCVI